MERTIGGTPIDKVFEKLKGEIPDVVQYKTDGKPYLEVNALRQYFDSIVPLQNYDFEIKDLKYVETSTLEAIESEDVMQEAENASNNSQETEKNKFSNTGNRACFTCTGILTLYDDMGVRVISKSQIGSCNVSFLKSTGQAQDLAMDAKNAGINAKKECIKQFGCGEYQLEKAKASKNGRNDKKSNSSQNSSRPVAPQNNNAGNTSSGQNSGVTKPKTGNGKFRMSLDESRQIKNTNKTVVYPVFCREYKNYRTNLVMFKNKLTQERWMEINNIIATGCEFNVQGKFELYGNEYRVVFYKMEGA